jgi:hypothetical protein
MPPGNFGDNSPFDSDFALIGTGVAPLVAASSLISQGKSVLVLNPDFDFFLEDSEMELDALLPLTTGSLDPKRLVANQPEKVLAELRPFFPGALESWIPGTGSSGFHDTDAPHVRQRSRLWITSDVGMGSNEEWEMLENAYLGFSDSGLNPKILDGIQAAKRFPGFSGTSGGYRGLLLPKFCEVDVSRYRNGILEFVRERVGQERFIMPATQIELMPGGLRFHQSGRACTARIKEKILIFHTPKMTSWILNQAKKMEVNPKLPLGVRLWEQWSLVSRDNLDPDVIGTFSNLVVWAEAEGSPSSASSLNRLSVLRAGRLAPAGSLHSVPLMSEWISPESLGSMSSLCYDFLKWTQFSVRSMKPRSILEWDGTQDWNLKSAGKESEAEVRVVTRCDGPLFDVVRVAKESVQEVAS